MNLKKNNIISKKTKLILNDRSSCILKSNVYLKNIMIKKDFSIFWLKKNNFFKKTYFNDFEKVSFFLEKKNK